MAGVKRFFGTAAMAAPLLLLTLLVTSPALGELFIGDLATKKCSLKKTKQSVLDYVRVALGDKKVDVNHDREGHCGEGAYLMRKADRKRWAVFGTKENCECFLRASTMLDKGK